MLADIASSVCVWFFIPLLRGKHNRDDKCYGLFSCSRNRFFGICGVLDGHGIHHHRVEGCQIYGHVESESFVNAAGQRDNMTLGKNMELT